MLVVAFRSGEAAASEGQPLMSSDAQRLRPAPLSVDAVAELAAVHGADDTAGVAQRTWEATRGNPFFVTELLRDDAALVATGQATAAAIPDAVSRAIVSRLGRLGSEARRIAEAGSVLEEHATLDQVSELAEVDAVDAAEAVRALAGRGVLIGIVSNTGRTPGVVLRRVLERHGLLGHFGPVIYSDEVGVRKPEAEIFRRTLAAARVTPAEALHIGDNPDADVVGAQAAGMRAAHYTAGFRAPAARADLIVPDLAKLAAEVFRVARSRTGE